MDQNITTILRVAGRTDIGKKRLVNQDAFRTQMLDPNRPAEHGLFLIADGVGGNLPKGEIASRTAVDAMTDYYFSLAANTDMLERVEQALQAAHTRVKTQALAEGVSTIGTTIVGLALAPDGEAVAFNVGDSHLYLIRQGKIRLISEDQVILTEGTPPARRSTKISTYLGQPNPLEPNYFPIEVRTGDTYVLCTDGLWSKIADDELRDVILSHPLEEAADTLVQRVLDRGAPDNLTLLIVQLGEPGLKKIGGDRGRILAAFLLILILLISGFLLLQRKSLGFLTLPTFATLSPLPLVTPNHPQIAVTQIPESLEISNDSTPRIVVNTPDGVLVRTGPSVHSPLADSRIGQSETAVIQKYAVDSVGQKWYYIVPESSQPGWIADGADGVEVWGDVSRVPLEETPQTPQTTETPASETADS